MSNKHEPTMAWHPETGENKVFNHPSEVPAEWLDTHPSNKPKEVEKAPAAKPEPMTRDEIVAALSDGGVEFDDKSKTKVLAEILRKSVIAALTSAEVEFDADASTKDLLAKLPSPE